MARKVVWTKAAWQDIEAIAEYIARDSKYYAASIVLEMRDAGQSLVIMASRGRIVPEFDNAKVRELLVANYRMIYMLSEKTVYILAVIHSARDLMFLWKKR